MMWHNNSVLNHLEHDDLAVTWTSAPQSTEIGLIGMVCTFRYKRLNFLKEPIWPRPRSCCTRR